MKIIGTLGMALALLALAGCLATPAAVATVPAKASDGKLVFEMNEKDPCRIGPCEVEVYRLGGDLVWRHSLHAVPVTLSLPVGEYTYIVQTSREATPCPVQPSIQEEDITFADFGNSAWIQEESFTVEEDGTVRVGAEQANPYRVGWNIVCVEVESYDQAGNAYYHVREYIASLYSIQLPAEFKHANRTGEWSIVLPPDLVDAVGWNFGCCQLAVTNHWTGFHWEGFVQFVPGPCGNATVLRVTGLSVTPGKSED